MIGTVIVGLYIRLHRLSERQLQRLDEENEPWLPRLGTLPLQMTIREIVRVLEASVTVSSCLERVAWLYCWLMPRDMTGPWMLYRLGPSALQLDGLMILRTVSRGLPSIGQPTTLSVRCCHGTFYACMIRRCGLNPIDRRYVVMFLVLWEGHRFAVVYAETSEDWRLLATALYVALSGASVELTQGMYSDINSAFSAAHTDLGGPTIMRVGGDPSSAARFPRNSCPQEQALDLRSAKHEE
ncbi:hypothetical protein MTO96_041518, partial [Rhipicephalus appendiculatus]